MYFQLVMTNSINNREISILEDIIINLLTPFDAYSVNKKLKKNFTGGYWNIFFQQREYKLNDYKRLIDVKNKHGYVPENILYTYASSSPCGKLQTYAIKLR